MFVSKKNSALCSGVCAYPLPISLSREVLSDQVNGYNASATGTFYFTIYNATLTYVNPNPPICASIFVVLEQTTFNLAITGIEEAGIILMAIGFALLFWPCLLAFGACGALGRTR